MAAGAQDCCGYAPRYSTEQRQELRSALSAAAHILQRWVGAGAQLRCVPVAEGMPVGSVAIAADRQLLAVCHFSSMPRPWSPEALKGPAIKKFNTLPHTPAMQPPHHHILRPCPAHSCYQPLMDSRTGGDAMLWMLRGACLAGRQLDLSTMHTALLYAGSTLVAAGAPSNAARALLLGNAMSNAGQMLPAQLGGTSP